ncbi:MAG: hypothetical protein IKA90_04310 [Clostridia bacterium]|nr:hypothetical protein [Clostridia bacterium]
MGLFDFFSKKKEQEKEQAAQRRKETEAKELDGKLYFEAVRRDDKKRNFYFMPLTSINRTDGKYEKNSVYGGSVSFLYMEVNGHRLPLYRITENFKLSLKPGKYNVKIYVQVNRDVGVEKYNEIRNIKGAHWVEQNNDNGKLTYAGFREATITVNETDMCYLLFRTNINACYNVGKVQQYGTKYVLDEIKHDYYFYQTSESELNRFCNGCIVSPTNYVYPPVDQTALQEYIKNHQHELPKSEQVAKAPAQKPTVETSAPKATVSKPAAPASKTITAKPAEQKTAVTPKTVATKTTAKQVESKPVSKTAETKTTAKPTAKTTPKAETKAPAKPVVEKPVKKTLNYPNGDKYVGYVLGDKKQGKGVLYYANGNKYEGDFANDLPHGKGSLLFNDPNNKKTKGHVYTGDFVCGKMHGFGVYAYPNGMRYEGGFANDVRDGKGKMYENQKFLFDTEYENGVDVKELQPKIKTTSSKKVSKSDKNVTIEIKTIKNTRYQYVGQTKDGKRHGFGISIDNVERIRDRRGYMQHAEYFIHVGKYQNDEPVGMCLSFIKETFQDTDVYLGEKPTEDSYKKGGYCMLVKESLRPRYQCLKTFYAKYGTDNKLAEADVDGEVPAVLEELPDLQVKKLKNGIYIGEIRSDMMEGYGYLQFDDGNEYIGIFVEDEMKGFGCLKSQTDLYLGYFVDCQYNCDGMLLQNYGAPNQTVLYGEFDENIFKGKDVSPKGMYIPKMGDDDDFDLTDEEWDDLVVDDFSDYSDYSKNKR